jgi:hypothetical protein
VDWSAAGETMSNDLWMRTEREGNCNAPKDETDHTEWYERKPLGPVEIETRMVLQ